VGAELFHADGRMNRQTDGHVEANSRFSQFLRTRLKTCKFCSGTVEERSSCVCWRRGSSLGHGPTKIRPCRIDCTAHSPCIRLPQGHCQEHVEINRLFNRASAASYRLHLFAVENEQSSAQQTDLPVRMSFLTVCPRYSCLVSCFGLCIWVNVDVFTIRSPSIVIHCCSELESLGRELVHQRQGRQGLLRIGYLKPLNEQSRTRRAAFTASITSAMMVDASLRVTKSIRRGWTELFRVLGYYAAWGDLKRRFGTTYRISIQESSFFLNPWRLGR
jgi:hypothetical protein